MCDNYDFSKSIKNPYSKKQKKQVTIRLDEDTIEYFKNMAEEKGNLRDCADTHKELSDGFIGISLL